MKDVHRPARARPNKVVKVSGASQRGGARLARHPDLAASLVAAHEAGVLGPDQDLGRVGELDPTHAAYEDATDHQYAAAAAAAAAAVQHHAHHTGFGVDDGEGEEEADADMDDDDGVARAMGQHAEHMDLNQAANILANGSAGVADPTVLPHPHAHQHQPAAPMGTPQLSAAHTHSMDPQLVKTTEELATDSGYMNLNVESALAKRLAREPGIRLAQQRRPEQQLNLARRSNVEALFAHIAGTLAPQPCKNCHKGHGPWNTCVVVDGQMCGSCANCWFNASGARCSFHETRNPAGITTHPAHSTSMSSHNPVSIQAADPSYAMAGTMLPAAPVSSGNVLPALGLGGPMSPIVQYTVNNAMAAVRNADKKTRQLMMIEIAAKQLALHIAEYEENAAGEETPGGGPAGPSVMGDEGSN